MINRKFIEKLKKDFDRKESQRRQIISVSSNILHNSKRAIFSLHRADAERANELLKEAQDAIAGLGKRFGHGRVNLEGAYRAAVEEYAEAKLFAQVLRHGRVERITGIDLDQETYLGGLCDLTGELVRRAINQAAAGRTEEALQAKELVSAIMAELIEFDLAGYLRTKYDQAKTNLKKIEYIAYELKLKQASQD
ncbi:hypothetical protein COX69_03620 [Candidatus Falkowbacteria bacterium CG_4_10_14_0_2_um_filter_48_10]|uniref:Translin n=1 Tax=Candidatus Falkowbacteria bacterium CG23_combo_of_CG06-09_8_20_14_all_49_15 TaxID=1974572 RepID=A0A2G9ZKK8_9BACT|nr:MAG: hypothetical protein COX22_03105 [Candidatus Falkowbacteria bacterium CG23_combo_of_CG06-09_8_20_14_all_49_15]PJA07871.1 MAG: hypothetical protein COX69_03620 [Candidatus Falkowbacteria bacterium CG_4_10_14_0_2_um_filter_48_10]